ncbi:MAG: hypothetical protein QXF28_02245 [Nitrososphaerota archaeon]
MKESTKMLIHYVTGFLILVTGAIHLISNNLVSLKWIKETVWYPMSLGIFLAAVLYHSMNGLRVILVELFPGSSSGKIISTTLFIIGVVFFISGLYFLLVLFKWW